MSPTEGGMAPSTRQLDGVAVSELVAEHAVERAAKPQTGPIVSLWGVGVAFLVVVVLIVTIAKDWKWGLDFFHVIGGAIWITIDLFMGWVIGPVMARMSIPARMELIRRLMPKLMVIMPPVVIATLTAGFQLARNMGLLALRYPEHWWLTASFIIVGLMAIIAYGVMEPANILVLLELRKPQPNGPLIAKTMSNFIYATAAIGLLQISTIIIMTRIATRF